MITALHSRCLEHKINYENRSQHEDLSIVPARAVSWRDEGDEKQMGA